MAKVGKNTRKILAQKGELTEVIPTGKQLQVLTEAIIAEVKALTQGKVSSLSKLTELGKEYIDAENAAVDKAF